MNWANKLRVLLLLVGDFVALYLSLFITLILRYQGDFYSQFLRNHLVPFSIVFVLWLVVFYVSGLYDLKRLRNNLEFLKILFLGIIINAALAALFFYSIPVFGITPKTNLLIFALVFAAVGLTWRRWFNRTISSQEAPNKLLIVGNTASAREVVDFTVGNPQLGYEIKAWLKNGDAEDIRALKDSALKNNVNGVVVPRHLKHDGQAANVLYELLSSGIEIHDLTNFYEQVVGKVPLSDLEEAWFLENLLIKNPVYEFFKRISDIVFGLVLFIIFVILLPFTALGIKLSSPGPIILKQPRVGKNGRLYTHYKFRTMREGRKNAWLDEDDKRITAFGKILRRIHLDELPQSLNLLRGDISLVGPRPDFTEFFEKLKGEIPYYTIRTVVKPGLTGWAQVNFPVTASVEETKERLGYDIYYLKNRTLILDLLIVLKTIKAVVTASGK